MILILHEDGRAEQVRDLSEEQLRLLAEGAARAFRYDHIMVTFQTAEVEFQLPSGSFEEGSGAPDLSKAEDFKASWVNIT